MTYSDSYDKIFADKQSVLAVMAHPDDNEIICGGIIARLVKEGKKVRLVVVTNGGKGFQDRTDVTEEEFAKLRFQEQINAGLELGIPESENFTLDIPDGRMENSYENIGKLAKHIREFKPDLIITHNPSDVINRFSKDVAWVNHRDHRNAALTTIDAAYPYSRDRGFFPEHFEEGLEPHIVSEFLFSDNYTDPEVLYFDISGYTVQKEAALKCHKNALGEDISAFMDEMVLEEGKSYERLLYVKVD